VSDNDLWLSKQESAELLGVNPRQIERREAQKQLRKKTLPREPGQTTARVVYSRADLLALKAGTPNQYGEDGAGALQVSGANGTAPAAASTASTVDAWGGFAQHLARIAAAFPSPAREEKPWLTLEEAAEWSGLPAGWLLRHAREGYVGAIDLGGRPKGGRWRFRRADLARIGS
jgi:hypothetical protein